MISYNLNYDSLQTDEGIETTEVYLSLGREIYKYHFEDYNLNFKNTDMIQVYAIATHPKGYKVKILLGKIYVNMDHEVENEALYPDPWEEMVTLIYED